MVEDEEIIDDTVEEYRVITCWNYSQTMELFANMVSKTVQRLTIYFVTVVELQLILN